VKRALYPIEDVLVIIYKQDALKRENSRFDALRVIIEQ
jgi:hypothetical protein